MVNWIFAQHYAPSVIGGFGDLDNHRFRSDISRSLSRRLNNTLSLDSSAASGSPLASMRFNIMTPEPPAAKSGSCSESPNRMSWSGKTALTNGSATITANIHSADLRVARQPIKYTITAAMNNGGEIADTAPAHTPTLRPPVNLRKGDQQLPSITKTGINAKNTVDVSGCARNTATNGANAPRPRSMTTTTAIQRLPNCRPTLLPPVLPLPCCRRSMWPT